MPRLAPKLLELNPVEKEELKKMLARHSTSQQVVKRARIIILASQGKNHRQIARELDISRKMARLWRDRWLELSQKDVPVIKRLKDAPRPGQPLRREFEYIRHGTQTLIASFDVGSGRILHESIGQTRTEQDFVAHVQQMVRANPKIVKWHLVMDCLNIHQSESLVRTDCRTGKYSCGYTRQERSIWDTSVNGNQS